MQILRAAARRTLALALLTAVSAGGTALAAGPLRADLDPGMVVALERDLGMTREQAARLASNSLEARLVK